MTNTFDPIDLRKALGTFATGVTVVTTITSAGEPRGFTANSFTSVSLDPPLVLVCLAKTARSCPDFCEAKHFLINILTEAQRDVAAAFGSPQGQRFDVVDWKPTPIGNPLIADVAAWLDCDSHDVIEAGDHFILVGRIVKYHYGTDNPLGYCRGTYVTFGLSEDAIKATQTAAPVSVSAIIEANDAVYLTPGVDKRSLTLPSAGRIGGANDTGSLLGELAATGINVQLGFLFSVYEDADTRCQHIVYRGEVRGEDDHRADDRFIAFDDIPWERISDRPVKTMLKRYVQEREADAFGIYVGDTKAGKVNTLA